MRRRRLPVAWSLKDACERQHTTAGRDIREEE
jgi:hypothetical protein